MRWKEPSVKDWMPVFEEGSGKQRIVIEKGEFDYFRIRFWRGDTEASRYVHASTAEEMEEDLVVEGIFDRNEARRVAHSFLH